MKIEDGPARVALRQVVQEATAALVQMDAERLEELARCCADLNREASGKMRRAAAELISAGDEMKLLGRILYETHANLTVLTRLHLLRLREAEDRMLPEGGAGASWARKRMVWTGAEGAAGYGDN